MFFPPSFFSKPFINYGELRFIHLAALENLYTRLENIMYKKSLVGVVRQINVQGEGPFISDAIVLKLHNKFNIVIRFC